jgi:hypothetical protein
LFTSTRNEDENLKTEDRTSVDNMCLSKIYMELPGDETLK